MFNSTIYTLVNSKKLIKYVQLSHHEIPGSNPGQVSALLSHDLLAQRQGA